MGEGTFGKVVKCLDKKESIERKKEYVAIKIIKNVQRYRDAAEIEIDVLQSLQEKDPKNEQYVFEQEMGDRIATQVPPFCQYPIISLPIGSQSQPATSFI